MVYVILPGVILIPGGHPGIQMAANIARCCIVVSDNQFHYVAFFTSKWTCIEIKTFIQR